MLVCYDSKALNEITWYLLVVIFRSRIVRRPTVLMQVIFVVLLND